MTLINNEGELNKLIESQVLLWLNKLKQDLPNLLESFIKSEYYDQYTPSDLYDRQYRILKAIVSSKIQKTGNTYFLDIYLDPTKVSYDPSIWGDYNNGTLTWGYIQGDKPETVFENISNGIHGSLNNKQTSGRFWKTFLESIGHGGVYDIFIKFKETMVTKSIITI